MHTDRQRAGDTDSTPRGAAQGELCAPGTEHGGTKKAGGRGEAADSLLSPRREPQKDLVELESRDCVPGEAGHVVRRLGGEAAAMSWEG